MEHAHRENSPVTQTTPEPTLLILGGWQREKKPPLAKLAKLPNTVLSRLSGHSDPIVLEPFDVTLCSHVYHERQICLIFHPGYWKWF